MRDAARTRKISKHISCLHQLLRQKVLLKYQEGIPAWSIIIIIFSDGGHFPGSHFWVFLCSKTVPGAGGISPYSSSELMLQLLHFRTWAIHWPACCCCTGGQIEKKEVITCNFSFGNVWCWGPCHLWCPWLCLSLPQQPWWLWVICSCLKFKACISFHVASGMQDLYNDGFCSDSSAGSLLICLLLQTALYNNEAVERHQ